MNIEFGLVQPCLSWVQTHHNENFAETSHTIAMLSNEHKIKAVTVYDSWTEFSCSMHIFSDGSRAWCSKQFLRACFAHAFYGCSLLRVTGIVDARNHRALKFDRKIGFKVEGVARDACGVGHDAVILGFTRDDWQNSRWWVPQQEELRRTA